MRKHKLSSKMAELRAARQTPGIVLPAVKEGMLKDFGLNNDRRWDIVHPSELSHQDRFCPRAIYMRITEGPVAPEKFDFVRENIFAEGNDIHTRWQERLRKYMDLWGDWKCAICGQIVRDSFEPPDSYGDLETRCPDTGSHIWEYKEVNLDAEDLALICGHADGGVPSKKALVEFKSVGAGTVRIEAPTLYERHTVNNEPDLRALWDDINRPFKTHLNQGDIYLWICKQRGLPFDQISYVYESKWNQRVKEFVITYDEQRSVFLVDQARSVMYAVEHKTIPECRFPDGCEECAPYDARRSATRRTRTVEVRAE